MSQDFAKPIIESRFIGLNDSDPAHLLRSGMFQKVENAVVSDNAIEKVTGSTAVADSIAAKAFNGLASYEKISASSKYLIASINGASNAQLYQWTGSGNFSAIGSANLTNSSRVMFETANEYLFGFNGDEVVDYDGTTVTKNRANVPLGYYPAWFHNYLFIGKTDTFPSRLFWSALGDPTTFAGTDLVDMNPGDSDEIMGLGKLQDELFVFKRNTIWSITGWSGATFDATTIATQNTNARLVGYGCVAPESIVSIGNDIYFLSFLGKNPVIRSLRKTQYATTLGGGIVSKQIEGTMATINKAQLGIVAGIFDGRFVYWAIPTGSSTVNNYILVLDTWSTRTIDGETVYAWSTMNGKNASHFAISTISGSAIPYFTDSGTKGEVYKFDSSLYSDDGTAIVMDVRTRDYMLDPTRDTKWKYLYLKFDSGSAGTCDIKARIDQAVDFETQENMSLAGNSPGLDSFILNTSVLGGAQTSSERIIFQHLTGKMLGLQFYEDSANACKLYDYEIYGIARGLRDA